MDTRDAKMTKDVAIQMEGEPERKKKKGRWAQGTTIPHRFGDENWKVR